jgi:hypothetical protein
MSDKIQSSNNSRFISVAPSNQTEFNPGQKCIIDLDESLGYIKGRDSYLCLDVSNTSTFKDRWSFPNGVGASALIQRVDFYSRATGQLLESLNNYNQWVGIENQYIHDDFAHQERVEGVGVPSNQYTSGYLGAGGEYKQVQNMDPSLIGNNLVSPTNTDGTSAYMSRRYLVPLKCGLFRWWDSEKLCPVLNMGGLRIELTFAPVGQVCKRLGFKNNKASDLDSHIVRNYKDTSVHCKDDNATAYIRTDEAEDRGNFKDIHHMGLTVGNQIEITLTSGGSQSTISKTITQLEDLTGGSIKIHFTGAIPATSTDITYKLKFNTLNYKVNAVAMRVVQMTVPKEGMDKLSKPMKYEFTSYDQFLNTLPTTVLRHQVPVSSVASKAVSMFSTFTDSTTEEDSVDMSYYTGVLPDDSKLNSIQYFINNRLYPLQSYNPNSKEDKPLTLNELNKALKTISKPPQNLGSSERGNVNNYSNTFLLSRELARGNFVFDLRNAEPEIRLGFSATRTNVNRINTYVFSKKVVDISPQGLMVEL